MSAGRVIFILRSDPSTTCTSWPMRSTRPASSEAFTPSACARAKASFKSLLANACGVCASTTRSRGIVPVINATSSGKLARFTSLTVSIAGMPRIAASHRRASSITRAICSGVTKGRTASCTSTISVSFATSRNAAGTESRSAFHPDPETAWAYPRPCAFPYRPREEWQRFGSCLERFRPDASRRGLANFRVYLKRGYGVKYQAVARARLTGVGFRKYRAALTVQRALFRKTRRRFCFARVVGTHAAISVSPARRGSLPQRRSCLFRSFFKPTKNHLPCRGLMNGGHNNVDTPVDHSPRAIHHHHRAIIQIRHALVRFFALAKNQYAHRLAGKHDGFQRMRQQIHVQHRAALHRGHFVQIEIVGYNFRTATPRQLHQFVIHVPSVREILLQNSHFHLRYFLNPLQYLQPAPPALPFQRFRRIRNHLQLVQHELRHSKYSFQKLCFTNIRDAAVDQYAGVQKLHGFGGSGLLSEEPVQSINMHFPAPPRAKYEPEIAKSEQCRK